jgi:hypothetical protein
MPPYSRLHLPRLLLHHTDDAEYDWQSPGWSVGAVIGHAHRQLSVEVPDNRDVHEAGSVSERGREVMIFSRLVEGPWIARLHVLDVGSILGAEQPTQLSAAHPERTRKFRLVPRLRFSLASLPPADRRAVDAEDVRQILLGVASSPACTGKEHSLAGHLLLSLLAGHRND